MSENEVKCPYCSEMIKADATVCKHCGRDVRKQRNTAMFAIFIIMLFIIIALVLNYTIKLYGG